MSGVEEVSCFYDKTKNLDIFSLVKEFSCYFYIISFFIGLIEIFLYFSTEKMFAAIDFNTLIFGFFIGMSIFF